MNIPMIIFLFILIAGGLLGLEIYRELHHFRITHYTIESLDPEGIEAVVEGQNVIIVKGIDKEKVGQYAAEIRDKRRHEPYKGKGIKYADETIRRKVGKTGKK